MTSFVSTDYPRTSNFSNWPVGNDISSSTRNLEAEFKKLTQGFYSSEIFSEANGYSHHYEQAWPSFLPNNATRFKIYGDENFHYNANWVLDNSALVCESPLDNVEMTQFWRMVVHSGVTKIVMLEDRCSEYWSSYEYKEHPSIEIGSGIKIVKRDIKIYDEKGELRVIKQYQVQNWPQNYAIPSTALAEIVKIVDQKSLKGEKYIVHSDVSGKHSGSFLATLEAYRQKTSSIFSIYEKLCDPEQGRVHILNSSDFCKNLYYTVAEAAQILLNNKETEPFKSDPELNKYWSTSIRHSTLPQLINKKEQDFQEVADIFDVWSVLARKLKKSLPNTQLKSLDKNQINDAFDKWCQNIDFCEITSLDLSGMKLRTLPEQMTKLTHLKILDLSSNLFTSVPICLEKLQSLEELYLQKNQIETISENFCKLTNLITVLLCNNKLTQLPIEFKNLKKLSNLNLSGNLIKIDQAGNLLSVFEQLDSLYECNLNENGVNQSKILQEYFLKKINDTLIVWEKIAEAVKINLGNLNLNTIEAKAERVKSFAQWFKANEVQLQNITELVINSCFIRFLPTQIGHLTNLTVLDLGYNNLEKIPDFLSNLTEIETLSLRDNAITEIDVASFSNLKKLNFLSLVRNPAKLSQSVLELGSKLKKFYADKYIQPLHFQTSQHTNHTASTVQFSQSLESIAQVKSKDLVIEHAKARVALWQALISQKDLAIPKTFTPEDISSDAEKFKEFFNNHKDYLIENVKQVNLSGKGLTCLPDEIYELKHLQKLDLSRNLFELVCLSILGLDELKEVLMYSNPIKPEEINLLKKNYPMLKFPFKFIEKSF